MTRAEAMLDRIEAGVRTLAYEAENATAVLEDRGYAVSGDQADAFAGRHADAALAAQQYADEMRATIAAGGSVDLGAAERVATAAELGGFLTDGRAFAAGQSYWYDGQRELAVAYETEKADQVMGTGAFVSDQSEGVHRFDLATGADLNDHDTDGMSA